MTLNDLLHSSFQSLSRTKARSVLTMLGIVIGIMSVIMMLTIGEAAQRFILSQVSSFGSDVLTISNGAKRQSGQPSLFIRESLTINDARRLAAQTWVKMITGKVMQSDQVVANSYTTNVQVVGTQPDEVLMNDLTPAVGTFFDTSAVDGRERVVVLGHDIAQSAFGADNPLGKIVKISKIGFKVIGVMRLAGTKSFTNVDKQAFIPVTAALDIYNKQYLNYIQVKTSLKLADATDRLNARLRDLHSIDNPGGDLAKDDFNISTQEDAVKSAQQITSILQILLTSIAAISLVVGGIGIMNIMYVTVTERTKEIGLRKAIGARHGDILGQFLVEAVVQTMLGGIIGIVLGISFSWVAILVIASFQAGWIFAISWNGVFLGFTVSAAIGIIFGYFPARKAAKLHPIEALRFE